MYFPAQHPEFFGFLTSHLDFSHICRHSPTERQENLRLWLDGEEVQQWSATAQKQTRYLLEHSFKGYCNETDPIKLFHANDPTIN